VKELHLRAVAVPDPKEINGLHLVLLFDYSFMTFQYPFSYIFLIPYLLYHS